MNNFNIFTHFHFYNKDQIKKFKASYKLKSDNVTVHTAFHKHNTKDDNIYLLCAYVSANNIYDIIDWLNSFEGYITNILDINTVTNDIYRIKSPFEKECYNIQASFKNEIQSYLIEDQNMLSYTINNDKLDMYLSGYDISYCLRLLYNLGILGNELMIRKLT